MMAGDPEKTLRSVVDACADCDTCRFLMDESCLLFPELYQLYDQERASGDSIKGSALGRLSPKTINRILSLAPLGRMAGKIAGIHPQRPLPRLAEESFFAWAEKNGLNRLPQQTARVAYFAGCTAGYLFPEVAQAAVSVLKHNGIGVYVPPQQCCGMPTVVEGDAAVTLQRASFNDEALLEAAHVGCDIVCSCPACGFLFKILLREKACYASTYQQSINAGADHILVPDRSKGKQCFVRLKKAMYDPFLKDDGYFSSLDPLDRIALSETVMDLGEYLNRLQRGEKLASDFGECNDHMVYYAPCHQREQGIGSPYPDLLQRIPGLTVQPVGSAMDYCGMGGSLGYKKTFHDASIRLGTPLIKKIQAAEPEGLITDCLSCRLQFQHLLPYPVYHPLEILDRSYKHAGTRKGE